MKEFGGIRTGVIGVGTMGQNHARVYSKISNLVAVADLNEAQGRKVAEYLGVNWYGDYREMLNLLLYPQLHTVKWQKRLLEQEYICW